jgi:hypothetical protein
LLLNERESSQNKKRKERREKFDVIKIQPLIIIILIFMNSTLSGFYFQ